MSSRLLYQSSLFSAARVRPWTCAQCASLSSSAVALKAKGKGRPPSGTRGRSSSTKRSSSRPSAKFGEHPHKCPDNQFIYSQHIIVLLGTTSRTRLVKDLRPKSFEPTEGGKERVKEKGKFEVAPKRLHSSPSFSRTPSFERRDIPDKSEDKVRDRKL